MAGTLFIAMTVLSANAQQASVNSVLAAWGDLDAWERYDPAKDHTEIGLGLKPVGQSATMPVAFSAYFRGKQTSPPATEIVIHASAGVRSNANSNRTLKFHLGSQKRPGVASGGRSQTIDLSSRLTTEDPTPGTKVSFAIAKLTAQELSQLADASSLNATVLGVPVTFRPDQLQAIRDFANKALVRRAR